MSDSSVAVHPGMLLLASAQLLDPHFVDTVVLLLDVNEDGALGVVLNRPSQILVADVLEGWTAECSEPEVLFHGGPVGTDAAIAVAWLRHPDDQPVGFRIVAGRLGMLDLDTPLELLDGSLSGLRIYAGYAGWGAQQLRNEIAGGDWYVVAGSEGDVFHTDPVDLRREVLRRQPGQLAWHTTRPADPDLN